jgi:hypothetical protein
MAADKTCFWKSFARAIGAELREGESITGASGIEHPMQAICVDDKGKRLILFSDEPNPRVAALIQGDIQATLTGVRVLVARPTVYDLAALTRTVFSDSDSAVLSFEKLQGFFERFNALPEKKRTAFLAKDSLGLIQQLGQMAKAIERVPVPALTHAGALLQQATLVNWPDVLTTLKQSGEAKKMVGDISLSKLYEYDSAAIDRAYGVCPVPLYALEEKDWEVFLKGQRIDEAQALLKSLNIFQYFFPPMDQLVLGVAERGVTKPDEITEVVASAPSLGHPYGANELVTTAKDVKGILDQLAQQDFIEIDHSVSLTEAGATSRLRIKKAPRESAISKLLNNIKVTVRASTKDLWPK